MLRNGRAEGFQPKNGLMYKRVMRVGVGMIPALTLVLMGASLTAEERLDEPEIQTLDVIEVPGTVIIPEERNIPFAVPTVGDLAPLPSDNLFHPHVEIKVAHTFPIMGVAQDRTAEIRGIRSPVHPAKAERPPYPPIARERGWEGQLVLRVNVRKDGSVDSIKIQKSSGHHILDDSAVHAVQAWRFQPAKDGEFPISTTVDLPIRFDLEDE